MGALSLAAWGRRGGPRGPLELALVDALVALAAGAFDRPTPRQASLAHASPYVEGRRPLSWLKVKVPHYREGKRGWEAGSAALLTIVARRMATVSMTVPLLRSADFAISSAMAPLAPRDRRQTDKGR